MAVIVSDTFTVSVLTLLPARVPDIGTGWVLEIDGSTAKARIAAANDYLQPDTGANDSHLLYTSRPSPSSAEYDVELAAAPGVSTTANRPLWLIGRYTDSSNYYGAGSYAPIEAADKKLYKKVAGVVTELASSDSGLVANDVLKFEVRNTTKKLFKNNVEELSTSDNSLSSAGAAGLGFGNLFAAADDVVTGTQGDNYVVTEVDVAAAASLPAPQSMLDMLVR